MAVTAEYDYPSLSRQHLANGLNIVLTAVRAEHWQHVGHAQHKAAVTRSLHVLSFVLAIPERWEQTFELLLALSPYMEKQGRWSEWLPYLRAGSQLAREIGDLKGAVQLDVWGAVIYRSQGRYAEARELLQGSAIYFATLGDDFQHARALNLLAWTERLAGNLGEAQRVVSDALRYLTIDDNGVRLERARSTSILGAIFYELNDWTQAEHYYRKTLQVAELALDSERLAWGYADLGLVLSAQAKYEEAVVNYQTALAVLESTSAPVQVAVMQMNLAGIYLRLDKPSEALSLCWQAQEAFQRVSDTRRLIMAEINIGVAQHQLAQFDEAQRMLISARGHAERLHHHALHFSALYQLGRVYSSNYQYHKAISTFEMALRTLELDEGLQRNAHYREEVFLHLRAAKAALEDADKVR